MIETVTASVEVEFDEATHTYRVGGEVIPNVTRIIDPLYDWMHVPEDRLARKGLLGQAVHKATELYDKDTLDWATVSDEVAGYLEAWMKLRRELQIYVWPDLREKIVFDPVMGFAGTMDVECMFPADTSIVIADIKSGDPNPAHGVQTAAYALARRREANWSTYPKRRGFYLRPDGTYLNIPYNDSTDYATFAALLTLTNWRKRHESR
jgi:hypothetical protein